MNDTKHKHKRWDQGEMPFLLGKSNLTKMADAYLDYSLNTSLQAYNSANHDKSEREILKAIVDAGDRGIISEELQKKLPHMPYGSVTSKFKKLCEDGVIECVGIRQNSRKRNQKVWRAIRD